MELDRKNLDLDASRSLSDLRRKRLKAAQVRLLYAQSGIGSVGAILGVVVLGFALWKVVSHERIVLWVLAYAALFLSRYCLIRSFHKREPNEDAIIVWGKLHSLAISSGALLWGLAGVWLFPQDSVLHEFLLSIFAAGIAAAGAVVYSPTKDYVANQVLVLVPLSGRFMYEFDEFHIIVGGVILLFAGALLLTGRRMHKLCADSLSLGYDKEELVQDLKGEIVQRDEIETELKAARDELEMRVEERTEELKAVNRTLQQEIVDRKHIENDLRTSEDKYRLLAENATDIVWTLDTKSLKFTYISPSVQKIRGFSPAELTELPQDKTLTPDSYERAMTAVREELARDGEPGVQPDRIRMLEFRELCKDGSIIDTEARVKFLRNENGVPTGLLGITRDITDRKLAEDNLRESEKRYRRLHETMRDAFVQVDMSSRIVDFNKAYEEMLGYSREELLELTSIDLTPVRWHAFEARILSDEILPCGQSGVYEKEYIHKSGAVFPVELRAFLITDDAGCPTGRWAIVHDITDRKRSEDQIRRQGELLRAVNLVLREALESDSDADIARTCLRVAEHIAGSRFGFIGEVNQAGHLDTIAFSDPGWAACQMRKADVPPLISNMEIRGIWGAVVKNEQSLIINDPANHPDSVGVPDGHPQLTSFMGIPLKRSGKTFGLIALANKNGGYEPSDMADMEALSEAYVEALDRKRTERALQVSEKNYRSVVENMQDVFYRTDMQGTITLVSPSGLGMTGYESVDQIIGLNVARDFYKNPEERERLLALLHENGRVRDFEVELVRRDGTSIIVSTTSHVYYDALGRPLGVEGVFTDITRRKKAEQALRESEE